MAAFKRLHRFSESTTKRIATFGLHSIRHRIGDVKMLHDHKPELWVDETNCRLQHLRYATS